jgi:Serpin (serine protease inhibitor)
LDASLAECVAAYSERIRGDVLAQHEGESVSSPLGIWVLLCACLQGAEGSEREQLESIVGCSREDAGECLNAFLSNVPSALHAAVALWLREAFTSERFARWHSELPSQIERGPIPTQDRADAWADRNTQGLIKQFPIEPAAFDLVLASALATNVSWEDSFEVARVRDRFSPSSPWANAVERVLSTEVTMNTGIVSTEAAGPVAVHEAVALEDLTVICVCADPSAERADVFSAAHEIARHIGAGSRLPSMSLFDLPLGDGHSWTITERERPTWRPDQRFESISEVVLPAWEIRSELALLGSPAFGAQAATDALHQMIGDGPSDARQVALATFDRYGFKAAAITTFAVTASARPTPTEIGVERTAAVRLDHPFAAIAVVGQPSGPRSRFRGLPVFEAWVHKPTEVPADHAHSGAVRL